MMLRHLGVEEGADAIEAAISAILAKSQERTPDIGGKSSTRDLGEAIASKSAELSRPRETWALHSLKIPIRKMPTA